MQQSCKMNAIGNYGVVNACIENRCGGIYEDPPLCAESDYEIGK